MNAYKPSIQDLGVSTSPKKKTAQMTRKRAQIGFEDFDPLDVYQEQSELMELRERVGVVRSLRSES